jgi:hypothetical integral membrane protein (TIGR02206 family)
MVPAAMALGGVRRTGSARRMRLFGALHLSLLATIIGAATVLVLLCRNGVLPAAAMCKVVGIGLGLNELAWWIFRYSHEGVHLGNLPLQLCDIAVWCAVISCLTLARAVCEFTWFIGIAGAGMALLTPDLYEPWPHWPAIYFFLAHGGVVIAAALLAFSGAVPFAPRTIWPPFGMLLGWAAMVGAVDAITGSNYMYLRAKPTNPSALDWLGPWPWYILASAVVAVVCFGLLWLPVRPGGQLNRAKSIV